MKPSIRSTALAFLVVGAIGLFFGFTGFPKPTLIVGGAVAALAGLGILFKMRFAWLLGVGHALINLGLSGLRLYQGIKGDEGGGILMPALWVIVSLYLLFSLLAIRDSFKK